MSFNFLPWPLYVLIAVGSAILGFIYIKKSSKEYPKSFVIGWTSAAFGAIIAGIIKFTVSMQIFTQYQEFLKILTIVCTSFVIILIMTGAYTKVRDNPEKRRLMLILISVLILTIMFMGAIVIS